MTDELTQLRQRAERAEEDAAVLQARLDQSDADLEAMRRRADRAERWLREDRATILAVAEAARAFLRADPAVENLADRLVALRAAVEEWER